MNKTARQYNLKCIGKNGNRVLIRVAPGFNVVEDEHWEAFVPKKGKMDPYVKQLKNAGNLEFGPQQDDMELEMDPDTKSKSKSEPMVKLLADIEKAAKDIEVEKANAAEADAKAVKAEAEAEKAKLELEKTKIELAKLKKADK